MLHIALYQPEIPPNTGNIIRLAANTGFELHLIKPLGFRMADKSLRRAGLDYHEFARVKQHDSLQALLNTIHCGSVYAFSTKGAVGHHEIAYQVNDVLLFGPETRGLPPAILNSPEVAQVVRIPMLSASRSLNLANSVSIAVYESWRQLGFIGASG